ncbi:protein pasi2 isoform X2 [Oratosquilla oratoria]|uniref:protein pasi2 isoform X2 n=1 Tax=Oratosquilla oratoria TaxID=337810 RepID=UPI003F76BAC9
MYRSTTPSISGLSTASRMTSHSVATLATTVQEKTGLNIPILQNAGFTNVQRGSVFAAVYSIFQGLFAIVTGIFDIYILVLATPGESHTGYYLFSYDFVYSGNPHVRNSLMLFGGVTAVGGLALIVTSIMLLQGLRKEIETRMEPWIWCMAIFNVWRFLIFIYSTVVNDMVFSYHIVMCIFWMFFVVMNVYAWLVVHSFYHELCEVARLEDIARVKMETASTYTGFNSRPTTPGAQSTISNPYPI